MHQIMIRVENTSGTFAVMSKTEPEAGQVVRLRYNPDQEAPFTGWHAWKVLRKLTNHDHRVDGSHVFLVTRVTDPSEIPGSGD